MHQRQKVARRVACGALPALVLLACERPDAAGPDHGVGFDHMNAAAHPPAARISSVPDYASISGASASETAGSLHLSITPDARPPRRVDAIFGGNLVFGYAWVDLDTGAGVAATIHPGFRDSRQNPWGWHTHVVQLSAGAGGADFCLVSASPNTPGGIAIVPDEVRVNMSREQAGLSASDLDAAAAFVVAAVSACASGLGVQLTGAPVLL